MNDNNWHIKRLRKENTKDKDSRTPFEKDSCKVIHSYAFRRLQGKIQIVSGKESDFHRNRLTHSIEVASIAKSIFCNIKYRGEEIRDENLKVFLSAQGNDIETLLFTLGLLHDIGHPPFGHGGEDALNYKMHKFGGFEGNAQTLRLITKISRLNLTFRTLLGTLKYPTKYSDLLNSQAYPDQHDKRASDQIYASRYLIKKDRWQPPKCYYDEDDDIVQQLLNYIDNDERLEFQKVILSCDDKHNKTNYKTFDCSVMDIADDISYSIHDLEDALFFNLIKKEELEEFFSKQSFIQKWKAYPKDLVSSDFDKRKEIIGKLVNDAIVNTKICIRSEFTEPLLKYYVDFKSEEARDFIEQLKKIVKEKLISTQQVKSIIQGGMVVIMQMFDAFVVNPDLLPEDRYEEIRKLDDKNKKEYMRVISDYISGMTDQYLFKMHQRLFGANNQNTFDVI